MMKEYLAKILELLTDFDKIVTKYEKIIWTKILSLQIDKLTQRKQRIAEKIYSTTVKPV